MTDAAAVLRNAGRLRRAVDELSELVERAGRVVDQTRTRLSGGTPDGASRLVSLHDPDARPICKGRLGKPVEFGYKAQVVDNPDGIVVDHIVEIGAHRTRRSWRLRSGVSPAGPASHRGR